MQMATLREWYAHRNYLITRPSRDMRAVVRLGAVLDEIRNPAYTGRNRCRACTMVNLCLATAFAVLVGVAVGRLADTASLGAGVGVGAFVGMVGVIYVHGYLVPGTPALTKRYFPDWLLARFETESAAFDWGNDELATLLTAVGVIEDDPAAADLRLTPSFERVWRATIGTYWDDDQAIREGLGQIAGIDPETIAFEGRSSVFLAWADGDHLASWESRAACVADVAAGTRLPAWDPQWEERPLALRTELLGVLRLFVERCPACDGRVSLSHEIVESCCRSRDVAAATCDACNARLFEMDVDSTVLSAE